MWQPRLAATLPAAWLALPAALLTAPAAASTFRGSEATFMSAGRQRLVGFGKPSGAKQKPLVESDFAAMAWCTYDMSTRSVPGWSIIAEDNTASEAVVKSGMDQVAIFQRSSGGPCALAFSGTNDLGDWLYNFDARGEDLGSFGLPGVVAHAGFMKKVRHLFVSPRWNAVIYPTLRKKCSEVIGVGHSLGAAVANLVAGVLNNVKNQTIQFRPGDPVAMVSGITISRLYTFGAPGVTFDETQLTNGLSRDGTFGGTRFFNFDPTHYDPVTSTSRVGLVHPAMKAVMLYNDTADGKLLMEAYDAATVEARDLPDTWTIGLAHWPSRWEHKVENYVSRMEALFGAAR